MSAQSGSGGVHSTLLPAAQIGHPEQRLILLEASGKADQESTLAPHIWSLTETISYLVGLVGLAPGDNARPLLSRNGRPILTDTRRPMSNDQHDRDDSD